MSDPGATFRSLSRVESAILEGLEEVTRGARKEKEEGGLTIAIANWNHRPYLPRAVRSALSAADRLEDSGFPAEVIVVDDASRDGSQKLLRSIQALYDEPRLKTLFLEHNLGLSRVRNLALRLAGFRYLCWLDADNELVPENVPLFLRSVLDTDATLVYGNLIDVHEGRAVDLRSGARTKMIVSGRNYIDAFALCDAEKLWRLGGYHPWFYGGSDWEMILHLISEEEEIVFVPAVLGRYSVIAGSMSRGETDGREEVRKMRRRMYTQDGTREWDPQRVGRVYHPELGYLD